MDALLAPLLLLMVFAGGTYYMLVPFLSAPVIATGDDTAIKVTSLELRKVNLYEQLREAEFEREMGLINDEDFDRTRADLLTETAQVIRELDQSAPGQAVIAPPVTSPASGLACPSCAESLEPGARFCSHCGTEVGADCPSCGGVVAPGDRFCVTCGRGLLS